MENTAESADAAERDASRTGLMKQRRRVTAALWLAIATLLITATLFPLFSVVTTLAKTFLVLRLFAAAAGLAALGLSIRARQLRFPERLGTWALVFGILGIIVDVMLIWAIVVGVAISRPALAEVELRAQGGPTFTVTFEDDVQANTLEWQWEGWAHFNTGSKETEITVTAPKDELGYPVSCTIIWDGEVVVQESSPSGTVTCRYED